MKEDVKISSSFIFYVDIVYTLLYNISMEGGKANEKRNKRKSLQS